MSKKEIVIEPLTRIEGHLGIQAEADLKAKKYIDAHSYVTMFRGWEIILQNREPADAIWITQRVCGVCPVPHAIASSEAVDMAYQAPPPPAGILLRDLIFGAEQLYDSVLGCFVLEGPDYSRQIVEKHNPDWWRKARRARAPRRDLHGFRNIGEIMTALNPLTGSLWLMSLKLEKLGRKMAVLLGAKHPHVNTIVPGGIALTLTPSALEQYAAMLSQHIAFAKEFIPIFDDLCDFVLSMGYEDSGTRPTNLLSHGAYEDFSAYTAKYEDMSDWGLKRKVSPGVVINGELITQDLVEIHVGVREFVNHSFYTKWVGPEIEEDPLGNKLVSEHPWNKDTKPEPGPPRKWGSKYSWATAPRWRDWEKRVDGELHVLEAGPLPRMWVTALSGKVSESTGKSLRFTLPKATVAGYRNADEFTFEWKIPGKVNTIERVRARAYYHAYSAYVVLNHLLQLMDLVKKGESKVWNKYRKPKQGVGIGMVEAMRGALAHWLVMWNRKVRRYQIITPSALNASPRGPNDKPGPYEEAIIGMPITEPSPEKELVGVDIVRAIRSFDPCLACCVNLYSGDKKIRQIDI